MTSQIVDIIFWRCFVSLAKFSYWPKFRVNVITSSGVMRVLVFKGSLRSSEMWNKCKNVKWEILHKSLKWEDPDSQMLVSGLQVLPFLSCYGKTKGWGRRGGEEIGVKILAPHTQITVMVMMIFPWEWLKSMSNYYLNYSFICLKIQMNHPATQYI